jgi:FKBP-type peptidyl-prolyl cis-trans isomerase FkpA
MRFTRLPLLLAPLAFVACLGGTNEVTFPNISIENSTFASALNVNLAASTKTASGLYYRDLTPGGGATFASGDSVGVYYRGYLTTGTLFDSKLSPATPFAFKLGVGRVIPGFDEGVIGMKVGGTRQIIIPSRLAYGSGGTTTIPPNQNLVFVVDAVAKY